MPTSKTSAQASKQRRQPAQFFLVALTGTACAQLLDIPSEPQLLAPSAVPSPAPTGSVEMAAEDLIAGDTTRWDAGLCTIASEQPMVMPRNEFPPGSTPAAPEPVHDDGEETAATEPNEVTPGSERDAGSTRSSPPRPVADAEAPVRCGPEQMDSTSGTCFFVLTQEQSWLSARLECQALGEGWDLASIHSQTANAVLSALLEGESWVGGSDTEAEAAWQWVRDETHFWEGDGDGIAVAGAFSSFSVGEPNGEEGSNCLRARPNGTWGDLECNEPLPAVCEGPKS